MILGRSYDPRSVVIYSAQVKLLICLSDDLLGRGFSKSMCFLELETPGSFCRQPLAMMLWSSKWISQDAQWQARKASAVQ